MKYKLIQTNKCCCKRSAHYKLVEDNDGYDLIQLKRGFQADAGNLRLEPGEPAFVMDTGRFYIGNQYGIPILINGGVPGDWKSSSLATIGDFEDGALIEVPYASMITADRITPTAADAGHYLLISVLDSNLKPVGEAVLTNWNFTPTSAQFRYGSYVTASCVDKLLFIQETPADIWVVSSSAITEDIAILTIKVVDLDGNVFYPDWRISEGRLLILIQFPLAGEAIICLVKDDGTEFQSSQ